MFAASISTLTHSLTDSVCLLPARASWRCWCKSGRLRASLVQRRSMFVLARTQINPLNSAGVCCSRVSAYQTNWSSVRYTSSDDSSSSSEHQDSEPQFNEDRTQHEVLNASLPFVLEHGWSSAAVIAGARSLGYSESLQGMFQQPGAALVRHFVSECNQSLVNLMDGRQQQQQQNAESKPDQKEFISWAITSRLNMLQPYISVWPDAMALLSQPGSLQHSVPHLATLIDDICYYSGERSHEFDWYVRRAALATIYVSAEVFMVADKSDEFADTHIYVNNRVANLFDSEQCCQQLKNSACQSASVASAFKTMVSVMLGRAHQ